MERVAIERPVLTPHAVNNETHAAKSGLQRATRSDSSALPKQRPDAERFVPCSGADTIIAPMNRRPAMIPRTVSSFPHGCIHLLARLAPAVDIERQSRRFDFGRDAGSRWRGRHRSPGSAA